MEILRPRVNRPSELTQQNKENSDKACASRSSQIHSATLAGRQKKLQEGLATVGGGPRPSFPWTPALDQETLLGPRLEHLIPALEHLTDQLWWRPPVALLRPWGHTARVSLAAGRVVWEQGGQASCENPVYSRGRGGTPG